jgi:Zn-dependent metalloprotease
LQDFDNFTTDINTKPRLSSEQALAKMLSKHGARKYAWQEPNLENALKERKNDRTASYYPKPELLILPEGRLVYKAEVFAVEPASREYVYVDAQEGTIIKKINLIHQENKLNDTPPLLKPSEFRTNANLSPTLSWVRVDQRDFTVSSVKDDQNQNYYLKNGNARIDVEKIEDYNGPVPIGSPQQFNTTDEHLTLGDYRFKTDNAFKVAELVSLGIETLNNYFFLGFNRWGFDGAWSPMKAYVLEKSLQGSFYDRESTLFFPFDPGIKDPEIYVYPSLKTVYHEFAHGLTVSESGLIGGYTEPGILNEALSDIWSYCLSDYFLKQNPVPQNDINPVGYQKRFGNDWITSSGSPGFQEYYESIMGYSVIRNAIDPNSTQHPAFYKGKFWSNTTEDGHFNSTVIAHWSYVLAEGGNIPLEPNPATIVAVQGIGIENLAKIIYHTTTNFLSSTSDFHSFALQTILAAKIIFGEDAAEVDAVKNAWKAVGIDQLDYASKQPCVPPVGYDPHFYISSFSMANIQTTKPKDFVGGYRDYTYLTIEAAPGYLYDVKIGAIKKPYFPEALYWTMWIDANADGSFDLTEKTGSGTAGVAATVPAIGFTKGQKLTLRVVLSKSKDAAACPDLNNKEDRYVEDYSIVVQEYCDVKNGTYPSFTAAHPEFTGLNFKNFKLLGCEEGLMFDHNVGQGTYFFDASNFTLKAGNAYSLNFSFKPAGLLLAPADQGANQFLSNCQTQAPAGFSLGDFAEDPTQDPNKDSSSESSSLGVCPLIADDVEDFALCFNKFKIYLWIDFNRNGVFETNEKYKAKYDKSTNTYYVNFLVPKWATTLSGYTIMRTYAYGGNGALYDATPCGKGVNGYDPTLYSGETVLFKAAMDIGLYLDNPNNLVNGQFLQAPKSQTEISDPNSTESSLDPVSFNLYPNPAIDRVDLTIKGTSAANFTLELHNSEGMRLLIKQPWDGGGLDISKYPNGIYLITLRRDREVYSQKLIIQR